MLNPRVQRCHNCGTRGHRAAECTYRTVQTITKTAEPRDPVLAGVYRRFGFKPRDLGAVRVLGAKVISTASVPPPDVSVERQNSKKSGEGAEKTVEGGAGWETEEEHETNYTDQWN